MNNKVDPWVPTPAFLYRNYLYKKFCRFLKKSPFFLEVGTGNGEFLKYLVNSGYKGESIDYYDTVVSFLNRQKEVYKGVSIKKGNILKYKTKKRFDAVFCFEVLEHIKDDDLAIKNICSLLKPGGLFYFSVPAHQKDWSIIDERKGHFRRYEKLDLLNKLKNNGMKPIKTACYGFPFLTAIRMITKSGKFIKLQDERLKKATRTGLSSLQQEYNPKIKFIVSNPILLFPLFKIMDLFLGFDLGLGYIVVAKKQ